MPLDFSEVVKILLLSTISFIFAMATTPILTHFLFKYSTGKNIRSDKTRTPIFTKFHAHKSGTPTMGGILIWGTTLILALVFGFHSELNFLTRSETLLPLGVFIASALVGLVDDILNIKKIGVDGGGFQVRHRLMMFSAIAAVAVWWFYVKLDWTIVYIPFSGVWDIGIWAIPFFFVVIIATSFSVNETDGLDGLAGGVLLAAFGTLAAIAFAQGRVNLGVFCGVISGALLAFLWFNIHPARFFMGDTGSMSLGVTLGVVSILTNTVWLLPIIGFILVIESLSVIIQVTSKKLRSGKKIFHATPIHHHFEEIGWGEPKIVMRFWIISAVMSVLGLVLFFVDRAMFL